MAALRHRTAKTFVLLVVLFAARRVDASPTARLVYVRGEGGESCPDESILAQEVATHLGYDPFRAFAENTLYADVRRESDRYVGNIKIVDAAGVERGARTLESRSDDCHELTSSMALSMSIAIDPRSAFGPAPEPPSSEMAPPVETPAEEPMPAPPPPVVVAHEAPPPPKETVPPRARPSTPRFVTALGAYGSLGEGPTATAGARLSGEVLFSRASVGLEVRGSLPSTTDLERGGSLRTSLVGAAIVPCARMAWASACAVAFLGRMHAETTDVPRGASENFVHVAVGARLGADVPLASDLALRISAEALGTVAPFVVDAGGTHAYESDALAGLAGLGLAYGF